MKALRKDPNARYQSAEEMRQDLLAVLQGDTVIIPPVVPLPLNNGNGDDSTRVLTGTMPPATVPPDEVYREIEEEPRSQLPFILTAFALLITLGILFFVMWNLSGGGDSADEPVEVRNVVGLQFDEAREILEAQGFVVNPVFENSDEAEAGEVFQTDPPAGEMAEFGSTIDVYVSVGTEEIPVPPVVGLTLGEAQRVIEDAGLVVGQIELRPDADFEEDTVIESIPGAGVEIGPAIPVDLVVSTGPEVITLPDVTDQSQLDAISELTDLGLRFAVNEEYDDDVAAGDVIRTEPEAGTEVLSGDTILLVVSLGPEPVEVPNLEGMTESQATNALNSVNLLIRVSNTTQPVADPAQDGLVVDQVPSPGATANQGDTVTVTLGEYTPPPTTTTTTLPPTTTTVPPSTTTTN
jgi:beta-lactam-binding protein with PASTA domain